MVGSKIWLARFECWFCQNCSEMRPLFGVVLGHDPVGRLAPRTVIGIVPSLAFPATPTDALDASPIFHDLGNREKDAIGLSVAGQCQDHCPNVRAGGPIPG